jgi:hypothetical protein
MEVCGFGELFHHHQLKLIISIVVAHLCLIKMKPSVLSILRNLSGCMP